MKPYRSLLLCGTLGVLLFSADNASAAWNNVFQATFFHHHRDNSSKYYAVPVVPAAPATAVYSSPVVVAQSSPCCEQPKCTTSYVQRCYYQPVTVMQTKTYYEPVTTMHTSYYYEPVVSYRYSSYYDPCTCTCQQVAVPTTCYQLKSRCCPVQSWVQKCCQVPVTAYQKAFYWEPHTTCCTTTVGAPIFGAQPCATPPAAAPPAAAPPAAAPPAYAPPPVNEQKIPGPPPNGPIQQEKYYGPSGGSSQIKTNDSNYNGWQGGQPSLGAPVPAAKPYQPLPQAPKGPVQLDKLASLYKTSAGDVKGQLVSSSNAPKANSQLIFVSADQKGSELAATTNATGQFQVSLNSGQWSVYVRQGQGQPIYHSKIHVNAEQPSYLTLVSK
jgi:hypothetical protein